MNFPTLDIRPYRVADKDAIVHLWQTCGLTRPWNDPHRDIARKLTVQPDLFLVGKIDGQVVASIMGGYDGHRGWINYLAVAPAHQRRGYASTLMHAVEQRLLELGCPKISLQIRAGNAAVVGFYQSLAFQEDKVVSLGKRLIPDTSEIALG